ncbi:MAG: alanine--glyoxylate aminotransferase family protein [Bacillota bacterium]|nr:alanine--glyoxylate aminotransferase family protein [Bacillota bacterium]
MINTLKLDTLPIMTQCGGPNPIPERVLHAISKQTLYHYDPVFLEIYKDTTAKVQKLLRTENDVIMMHGEAVLGLEAAAASLVNPGDTCLNLVSGPFGQGYARHLKRTGGNVVEIVVPFNESVKAEQVEDMFRKNPDIRIVSMVHSETPAGTLNPVKEICEIAKKYGAVTVADAVSSAGGIDVQPDWGIDVCITSPQKCISGTPGTAIAAVSEDAWNKMKSNDTPLRGSILSMLDMKERWLEGGRFPYTPSVNQVYSINEAITVILEEGLDNVLNRHKRVAEYCRYQVKDLGLELWPASDDIIADCVTAITMPEGTNDAELRGIMRDRYKVMISGSHGDLSGKLIRIGHMGHTAYEAKVMIAVDALKSTLKDLGLL